MKKNSVLIIILFFFIQSGFSQTLLKGKVISETLNLDGIQIINLTNQKSTSTEESGLFSILAKPTDTLLFSGMQIKGLQIVLKTSDFSENLFFVRLQLKVNQLDEVVVKNYPKINAISLGIIPKNTKSYTPAQRRLKTAGDFKPIHLLGLLGGSLPVDPILNKISGRTAMLKKELAVEKKEFFLDKLSNMYEDAFFIENLKIPSDYVKGFKLFAIEDEELVASLKSKNRTMTAFLLSQLSLKYNDLLKNEEK
jgi:hypothetical protein